MTSYAPIWPAVVTYSGFIILIIVNIYLYKYRRTHDIKIHLPGTKGANKHKLLNLSGWILAVLGIAFMIRSVIIDEFMEIFISLNIAFIGFVVLGVTGSRTESPI